MKALKENGQGGADWMLQESSCSTDLKECRLTDFLSDIILETKKNKFLKENQKNLKEK